MTASSLTIPVGSIALPALLSLPHQPRGLVVFVHGSGSSRFSPRNQAVAAVLQRAGLATVLFDLLTDTEERLDAIDHSLRFDIDLFSERLLCSLHWLAKQPRLAPLFPVGLFGASSGAAAALQAAAAHPEAIAAVVSRGGRPDLAGEALERVCAPTLLIVGGRDPGVLLLNRRAAFRLRCPQRLEVIPGASHLFAEPGSLDAVAVQARDWYLRWLHPTLVGAADRSSVPGGPSLRREAGPQDSGLERTG